MTSSATYNAEIDDISICIDVERDDDAIEVFKRLVSEEVAFRGWLEKCYCNGPALEIVPMARASNGAITLFIKH